MPNKSEEEEIEEQVAWEFSDQSDMFDRRPVLQQGLPVQPPVVDLPALVPVQPAEVLPNQAPVVRNEPIRDQLVPVPVEAPKAERPPDPPVGRTLRDRGTLRAPTKYADEFVGLGSKKQN